VKTPEKVASPNKSKNSSPSTKGSPLSKVQAKRTNGAPVEETVAGKPGGSGKVSKGRKRKGHAESEAAVAVQSSSPALGEEAAKAGQEESTSLIARR
jgi:hypothetical protein